MGKKKKWKYKFLTEEKFQEYQNYTKDQIIEELKVRVAYIDENKTQKKHSESLKEIRSEISEHRKNWEDSDEIEHLQAEIKAIKEKRDAIIEELLEDKKALEGGFNDAIKSGQEHRDALLHALRFHN